ncbi:uncharacterized protein [Aegilops tauschii subsp. strangulata]|uniref:uncharacterized protein n=1 Tax=Aegilops tauschii subsp. strangulata TaxID=200361 RepID=UPI003CC8570C
MISEIVVPGPTDVDAQDFLREQQHMVSILKEHLTQAQARMKKYADKKRLERTSEVGDMVYLRMQPYRMAAFGIRQAMKLTTKLYGPYRILQKIGHVAYKLQLLEHIGIHPVFHASQLKKHLGAHAIPSKGLPLVDCTGKIKTEPLAVFETRSLPHNGILVTEWLINWENLKPEEVTWEDANFIKQTFPDFFESYLKISCSTIREDKYDLRGEHCQLPKD